MTGRWARIGLPVVLALVLALGMAAEAGAVSAVTSGGSIAFARDNNIWLTSPDGLTQRPLTTDGTASRPYYGPTQSDDGSVVVAVQDRGVPGATESFLYVMNRRGTLLRLPFAPPQYTTVLGGACGFVTKANGVLAAVSPDGSRIAVDKLGEYFGPGYCKGRLTSEIYVIDLDGTLVDDVIVPQDQSYGPLSLLAPRWVGNDRLLMRHNLADGISYYDLGTAGAETWVTSPGFYDDDAYGWPTLTQNTLATTGIGPSFNYVVRLSTTNGALPAAPTVRCDIEDPEHRGYLNFSMAAPTLAPDAGAVAWVEYDGTGSEYTNDIYVSPVGNIGGGDCSSLDRRLLVAGASDPSWGQAAVGPAGSATNLPVCPAANPGTPPDCQSPAAPCPAGTTPPSCTTPPTSSPAGPQSSTPVTALAKVAAATAKTPSAGRIVRVTVKLSAGCSRPRLKVSGRGVSVTAAKRLGRSRCQITLRVAAGATGRRDLLVKRGGRTTRRSRVIRL